MIIQCEQCRTKFRLDDSRVKDTGVKVRCAKCKHIFTVRKELSDSLPQSEFAALLDQNRDFAEQAQPVPSFEPETESAAAGAAGELPVPAFAATGLEENPSSVDPVEFELPEEEPPPFATQVAESGSSATSEWALALETDKAPFPEIGRDFDGFDFGAAATDADSAAQPQTPFSESSKEFQFQPGDVSADITAQLPDFPDFTAEPVIAEEKPAEPKTIATDGFSFDLSETAPQPANALAEEPAPVQAAPAQAPAPREELRPEAVAESISPTPAAAAEELPPLSISSRRKQSPLVKVLLVVLVLVAAAAVYFQYGSSLLPMITKKIAPESGSITLRSINAAFVKNATLGELLVITGEAVNGFATPRTSIQVQGVVYGDNNQILVSKNAFSGNILSNEQLAALPLDIIEKTMANQFGGTLENLEVAPGKAVPFMIVITNLPQGAKNFGALPAGSAEVTKPKP